LATGYGTQLQAGQKKNQPNIELLGRGYQPFKDKEDGLLP
jgi:hypothetical protein